MFLAFLFFVTLFILSKIMIKRLQPSSWNLITSLIGNYVYVNVYNVQVKRNINFNNAIMTNNEQK